MSYIHFHKDKYKDNCIAFFLMVEFEGERTYSEEEQRLYAKYLKGKKYFYELSDEMQMMWIEHFSKKIDRKGF